MTDKTENKTKEEVKLTPEQEDSKKRLKDFHEGFEKLVKDTQYSFKPQITSDGPTAIPLDIKPKEESKIITPNE